MTTTAAPPFVPLKAGRHVPPVPAPDRGAFAADLARMYAAAAAALAPATIIAYDGIDVPPQWPTGARVVYAYIDGLYANLPGVQAWVAAHAPGTVIKTISVFGNAADMYDCEPGNGTPADAPAYWQRAKAAGIAIPEIYNPANWTAQIRQEMGGAGIAVADYFEHSAHYGLGPHICGTCGYPAADNTQWTDVGAYDISTMGARYVTYLNPAPATPPPAPVPPPPVQEDSMISAVYQANGNLHVAEITAAGELLDHWHRPGLSGMNWTTSKPLATGCDPAGVGSYSLNPPGSENADTLNLVAPLKTGGFVWLYATPGKQWSGPTQIG